MKNKTSDFDDTSKAKEPAAEYTDSKRIQIFNSFSESSFAQYQHWAGLSPEERLSEFFMIMSRFYVFTKPDWKDKKIIVGR